MNCVIAYYCIVTLFVLFSSPGVVVPNHDATLLEQEHDSSASRALATTTMLTCPNKDEHRELLRRRNSDRINEHKERYRKSRNGVRRHPKKRLYKHRKKTMRTIGEIAKKRGFTMLVRALTATGLWETVLEPSADLTLFAPTDRAFNNLGDEKLKELFDKPELLKKILLYHVVGCTVTSRNIAAMKTSHITVPTLSGDSTLELILRFRRIFVKGDGNNRKNLPRVIKRDTRATNGVIHVIDEVILPRPSAADLPTITKLAQSNKRLRTLVKALDVTGLVNAAGDANSELTVFAPTDRALKRLGKDNLNYLLNNPEILKSVLNYHIAGETTITSEMLVKMDSVQTLLKDQSFGVTQKNNEVFLKGNANTRYFKIKAVDRKASNGVVHVIDRVLMPTLPICATAALNGYSLLTKALKETDLSAILNDMNQRVNLYTVFAPTDAAFQALGQTKLNDIFADKELLRQILSTHVVVRDVKLDSTAALTTAPVSLTTMSGSMIEVYQGERNGVYALLAKGPSNQYPAKVVATDVDATNGIIYGVDQVLLP